MSHSITINGVNGQIKWGYVLAAEVKTWSVSVEGATGGELAGEVNSPHNEFAASQQPLKFVVPRESTTWKWPIQKLQMTDGRVTARLGPFEE